MNYQVYILQSEATGCHYCGHTDDVERRLRQHNDPEYHGSKTTKRFPGPWRLIWHTLSATRGEAMMLEQQIKKRGIKRYLEVLAQIAKTMPE